MKKVYLGNKELTALATVTNGGGGGDDTQKWLDYFNGTLTEFTVPEGVTKINSSTFVSCTGLTSLTLPSSIASIEKAEMCGMGDETKPFSTLKTMTVKATTPPYIGDDEWNMPIPTTIETIYVPKYSANIYKAIDVWDTFADKIQALPQNETVVTYKDGTTKAFDIKGDLTKDNIENITAATKVVIGDDVTSIGTFGFMYCGNITGISLSDSVTKLNISAFANTGIKTIIIPASVTSIGDNAFGYCNNLSSVIIKNSSSKLEYNYEAFYNIASNAKLYVPSNLLSDYQADSKWSGAFKGGIYSTETSMKVTYADNTEKTFTGLTVIKSDTDSNKKNAKSVVIYDTVLSINKQAFYGCSGMTSVVIPDSVMYIGYWSFYKCPGLTSVVIPASVTSLGFGPFQECSNLASVTIKNSTNKLTYTNQAFCEISSSAKLYVPSNLLADYQADSNWTGAFGGGIFAIQ